MRISSRDTVLAVVGSVSLAVTTLVAPAASAVNPSCTDAFDPSSGSYIGDQYGTYECDVPAGRTSYDYVVRGGYGADPNAGSPNFFGALGAKITGTIAVTPGETLKIVVADHGWPAYVSMSYIANSGGGGGGASSIFQNGQTYLVAGGGGGTGWSGRPKWVSGGAAGAGTSGSSTAGDGAANDYNAGDGYLYGGGGAVNGAGGAGGSNFYGPSYGVGGSGGNAGSNGGDGSGGTGSAGGAGFDLATGLPKSGGTAAGANCTGGNVAYQGAGGYGGGGNSCTGGGGGGAGWAGGGGGGAVNANGAGGGGGSSYVPVGATAVNTATDTDDKMPRVELVAPAFATPTITNASPASVPTAGGTTITITGTEFVDGQTTVTVGGQSCTNVVVLSATSLTCETAAHAAGQAAIVVTTPGGDSSPYTDFEYADPAPAVTNVAPAEVSTAGGATVTITGTDFVDGSTTVQVGGKACTNVTVTSATSLTCVVSAHAAGQADVVVTTPAGSSAAYTSFRYAAPVTPKAPILTLVSAGDRKLTATWSAPTSGPKVTGYRVVAGPGGKSCTATAGQTSCTIDGLTNNTEYALHVVAITESGDSPDSNSMSGIPRADEAPAPAAPKKSKKPGKSSLIVNGQSSPGNVRTSSRLGTTVFTDGDWSLSLTPENKQGNPQIVINRALQPEQGQFVRVTAGGFLPNSKANVFLFTKRYDLGVVSVQSDGTFSEKLRVPKGVPAGDHTIQVNGYSYDGMARSANLGVVIRDAAATLTAVPKSSKATLQVMPQCRAQYAFHLQRQTNSGWASVMKMRTKGQDQRRSMDLNPGYYRAKVHEGCGNPAVTTGTVRIGSRIPANG